MLFDDKSKGIAQAYLNMLEARKQEPKMDPVGKHDADIDNDGDKDKSDAYLIKRRAAISKSVKEEKCSSCGCATCKCVKEEKVDEAACGYGMKSAKKEALEIAPAGKSEVKKKGMMDKDGGDEEEDDDTDEKGEKNDSDEIEITIKKGDGDKKKKETSEKFDPLKHVKNPTPGEKKAAKDVKRGSYADRAAMLRSAQAGGRLKEAKTAGSAYAIGMDSAMKSTGDNPPLEKSTIKKAHKIAKGIMKKESTVWNWEEILDAPEEEIDALIENLDGDDLQTFVAEFNALTEEYKQAPPNETTVKTGQETLTPRAAAEKAFAAMHAKVEKDHPFDKDQHDKGVSNQSPTRPGDKRANEPMKTLKDIRK